MQLTNYQSIKIITDFILKETNHHFVKLSDISVEEPLFRFNFFMLVRMNKAFFGIDVLLNSKNHEHLFYSFSNILRPILMDIAYSGTLHKIFNETNVSNKVRNEGARFIFDLLLSESNKIKKYIKKSEKRIGIDWSSEVDKYEQELKNGFTKFYPDLQNENRLHETQIERIFSLQNNDMPMLNQVWDVYKIFSQMTHLNDFYGEFEKQTFEAKSGSVFIAIQFCLEHLVILIRNITVLPEHHSQYISEFNRIRRVVDNLKVEIAKIII